jgi:YggT family protein
MAGLLCNLIQFVGVLVNVYTLVLLVYAVLSWIPDLRGGRFEYYLSLLVEPLLQPIRRIIPPIGGLDIAFLVLILVLQFLIRPLLGNAMFHACTPIY